VWDRRSSGKGGITYWLAIPFIYENAFWRGTVGYTIYSVTGCVRCKIVKRFMEERGIVFVERDMKADGGEDFRKFYAANRGAIYRGADGIEFPILTDGLEIRQSLGVILAWLSAGPTLEGFFRIGRLHGEWVDGIDVSGGDQNRAEEFMAVLRYLKKNAMKIRLDTNGKNSSLLKAVLAEKLADRVIMAVQGPLSLYDRILGHAIDQEEIRETISLVPRFPEYGFETTIAPLVRGAGDDSGPSYLTPEEIAETAALIKECGGGNKHPYLLKTFRPESCTDDRLKVVQAQAPGNLFKYRSAARFHLVLAEIEKSS